jgi:hypothetical protein
MLRVIVTKNEKAKGLIGFVMSGENKHKVCFLDKSIVIPDYLTGCGVYELNEDDYVNEGKTIHINNLEFPVLQQVADGLNVLCNASVDKLSRGYEPNHPQCLVGKIHPRAYFYDVHKIRYIDLAHSHDTYKYDASKRIVQLWYINKPFKPIHGDIIWIDVYSDEGIMNMDNPSALFIKLIK